MKSYNPSENINQCYITENKEVSYSCKKIGKIDVKAKIKKIQVYNGNKLLFEDSNY